MRSILLSLIAYILISLQAFAQNLAIQSEFIPSQQMSSLKEGDLFEATLRFWPIENVDLSQFKKLEKAVMFNAFYLAQISSLDVSANNADVIELKGLFIVKSAKYQSLYTFKYNESLIEMRLGDIQIKSSSNQSQDFYIQNQKLEASYLWGVVIGFFGILGIAAYIKRNELKLLFQKIRPNSKKIAIKKYDELFRIANKREDFEKIYQEKNHWLELLEIKSPAHQEFFKILDQYQYKKEWNNEDYTEVRASFDVIRRSFEK